MMEIRITGFLVVIAFIPLLSHESKNFILAFQQPESQLTDQVRERLLKHIKPNERVALSSDQYFTLRNFREVADLNFICKVVDGFDFIYATDMKDSRRPKNASIRIPCWSGAVSKCFIPIDDLSVNQKIKLFSWESPFSVRGHGGVLYKNVNCPESLVASKTTAGIKKARATQDGPGLIRLLSY